MEDQASGATIGGLNTVGSGWVRSIILARICYTTPRGGNYFCSKNAKVFDKPNAVDDVYAVRVEGGATASLSVRVPASGGGRGHA